MIKILLLIFLIILTLTFIFISNSIFFKNDNNVKFLKSDEAKNFLLNSYYFDKFNKNDIISRNLNSLEIKSFYAKNIMDFTRDEKSAILWIINSIKKRLGNLKFLTRWGFIKVTDNIENGYPHTRNIFIVLSESIISNIENLYNNNSIIYALKNIGSLFVHENVHVYQKMYPKIFENLYTYYWNFTRAKSIKNSDKYYNNVRNNPDGLDLNWVYDDNIWILSIYKEDKKMNSVRYVGIYLEKLNNDEFIVPENPKIIDILELPKFKNFFRIDNNFYHPNEICAEIFSIFYLFKMGLSKFNLEIEAFRKFSLWYSNHKSYFE